MLHMLVMWQPHTLDAYLLKTQKNDEMLKVEADKEELNIFFNISRSLYCLSMNHNPIV